MSRINERQFKVAGRGISPFVASKSSREQSVITHERTVENQSKKKIQEKSRGPYGSSWGFQQLNWLHLHFAVGYDTSDLFSQSSELPKSCRIIRSLQERLGADWQSICDTNYRDSLSIYPLFQKLIYQRKVDDDFKTATHTSTNPSSPSSSRGLSHRSSESPQHNRQSTTSRQVSERETTPNAPLVATHSQPSTPGLIGRKRPLESTPSPQGQHEQISTKQGQLPTTPPFHQTPEVSAPSTPTTPRAQMVRGVDDGGIADIPALMEAVQNRQISRLIEEEEEEEKAAQDRLLLSPIVAEDGDEGGVDPAPDVLSEAASQDKSEKMVELVGSAFLSVVGDAINATKDGVDVDQKMVDAQALSLQVADSDDTTIWVDGIPMTAKPDLALFCKFGAVGQTKTIEVVLEVKRRNHMRPPSGILGQECAELLGLVSREKRFLEKVRGPEDRAVPDDKKYHSYLISWHGLMAYVSRLDTTHGYLEQLNKQSSRLQSMDPPRIRRSRLLNLTKPQDRIELATVAARIAVEQLAQYNRNRVSGLMARLLNRHEPREGEASSSSGALVGGEKLASRGLMDKLCSDCKVVLDSYS